MFYEGINNSPVTCIKWRPHVIGSKHIIVAVYANGLITHYHAPSGKSIHSMREKQDIFCVGYRKDANQFCTVGLDRKLRL